MSNSQNVKHSSHGNKRLRKIKINFQTKVEICISIYSNVDVERSCEDNFVPQIVHRSKKLTEKSYFKLVVGHTTKQMKQGRSCDI